MKKIAFYTLLIYIGLFICIEIDLKGNIASLYLLLFIFSPVLLLLPKFKRYKDTILKVYISCILTFFTILLTTFFPIIIIPIILVVGIWLYFKTKNSRVNIKYSEMHNNSQPRYEQQSVKEGSLSKRQVSKDIQNYIIKLQNISNSHSEYASGTSDENKSKMLAEIEYIESQTKNIENTDLYYSFAIAYRNYTAWYIRGDDRKFFLEKCLSFLEKSSPDHIGAYTELGRILIEESLVRDIPKGIKILKELDQQNKLPHYLNSVLSKAERQSGNLKEDENFSLLKFADDPSPAVFCEERKRFRALIRKFKKENEIEKLKSTLNDYYKLGLLVKLCYGDLDSFSSIRGYQYDNAEVIIKKYHGTISGSYEENGRIKDSEFISDNDWKTFEKVFMKTE